MSSPVVVGLDFGGSKIAAAVAGLDGLRLGETVVETAPSLGARPNLERGIAAADDLAGRVAPGRTIVAVGACTFGIPTGDGIRLAPAIPGWERIALRRELELAFPGSAVRVATDVKAAAAAEARAGALKGYDPALYVNLGTGLAVAIVINGAVVSGAHGASGEVGYSLREPGDLDVPPGERVVLEQVVSGMALAAAGTREAGIEVSAADVFASESGNEVLAASVDSFVKELCFHLVNLAVALDPARIAVGGGMVRSWSRIQPQLSEALATLVPFPPELVRAAFPYDAALVGAIDLGIEAAQELMGDGQRHSAGRPPRDSDDSVGAGSVMEQVSPR
jgi:glucokinase